MGARKDKLLKEYRESPCNVGDYINIPKKALSKSFYYKDKELFGCITKVLSNNKLEVNLLGDHAGYEDIVVVNSKDIIKNELYIGANPFPKDNWRKGLNTGTYTLDGILYMCGIYLKDRKKYHGDYEKDGVPIPEINWNPYVIDKEGKKQYYQRGFCWSLTDEQLLIESIYNSINCGIIIVRKRSEEWIDEQIENGNKEVAFFDIIDGKQRLHTLKRFVNDEFPDMHGNYYSDFSRNARFQFRDSYSFQYASLGEKATDKDTIRAFLNVNFTGIPMSKEHIDYVKDIQKHM